MSRPSRKLAGRADDLRRLGTKVLHYRRDVLPANDAAELEAALDQVETLRADREADEAQLQNAVNRLDRALYKSGGSFYPRRQISENIEMLLVAAILAIGVRTYFIQPYRIPTNSMYPTYNGMTHEVYETRDEIPAVPLRALRGLSHGATNITVTAPAGGEIIVPLVPSALMGYQMPATAHRGRKWFGLLPEAQARYHLMAGDVRVFIDVPADFSFQKVVLDRFGPPRPEQLSRPPGSNGMLFYHTGVHVERGDLLLSFDILLGDQLFVDRFSYHFFEPEVGDPFVFRTDEVPGMSSGERGKYYVKRLVGKGGDTLQVEFPVLLRNGAPITGAEAFDLNASQQGDYEGYRPTIGGPSPFDLDDPYTLPPDTYYAMGDNSDESSDSRRWGTVPSKAVIGKPLFIYWPFANNFGPAK